MSEVPLYASRTDLGEPFGKRDGLPPLIRPPPPPRTVKYAYRGTSLI